MASQILKHDALGTDVDQRRVQVGDVSAWTEELVRGLLLTLALEHAHLHAGLGAVF